MSPQITQTTMDLVNKLDDMPVRNISTILPFKNYDDKDIKDAADLIQRMLRWAPQDRISCEAALKHRFFKTEGGKK